MSLNRTEGLQLFQGELAVQHHKNVDVKFKKTKYASEHLKGTKTGELYLTNFRLFFVNDKKNDMLRNLSMPFKLIKDFEIKQPTFGANYLEGKILAEENGGWQGSAEFEITFKSGGAVEVGQDLVRMAKNPQMMYAAPAPIIIRGATIQTYEVNQPQPSYVPQAGYAPNGYQPSAPPMYSQPGYPMAPVPPPYPQAPQPYPQAPAQSNADAKAQEAMGSSNYLPPSYSAPVQNPPPYYDGKKNQ